MSEPQKVTRRRYLKYLAGVAAAAAAAGVGYGAYEATKPTSAPTETITQTLTGVAPSTSRAPSNIVLWSDHEEDSLRETYVETATSFMARTGATVTSLSVPTVDFPPKWGAALAANIVPDIITPTPDLIKAYIAQGNFEPLDDVISQYGSENLLANANAEYSYQGKTYGIDIFNFVVGLTYRKDLLQAASVEVPSTWDQLLKAAEALTDKKNNQYGFGFASGTFPVASWGLYTFMRTNNADVFDENGNVIFDSTETTETLEFMRQLAPYWPAETKGWSWSDCKRGSYTGLVALDWYSAIGVLQDAQLYATPEICKTIGAAPTPMKKSNSTYMEMTALCIPKGGQSGNLDLTKQLVLEYLKPENAVQFSSGRSPIGYLPALKLVQNLPAYWNDPLIAPYADLFKQNIPLQEYGGAFGRALPQATPVLANNVLATALQRALYTTDSISSIIADTEAKIKSVISS